MADKTILCRCEILLWKISESGLPKVMALSMKLKGCPGWAWALARENMPPASVERVG